MLTCALAALVACVCVQSLLSVMTTSIAPAHEPPVASPWIPIAGNARLYKVHTLRTVPLQYSPPLMSYSRSQSTTFSVSSVWSIPLILSTVISLPATSHPLPRAVVSLQKKNPAAFLSRAKGELGGIFQLDLAGLKMTIVCDPLATRQVRCSLGEGCSRWYFGSCRYGIVAIFSSAPNAQSQAKTGWPTHLPKTSFSPLRFCKVARAHPSVLSFNKAIADFGFLELLGEVNSYLGSGAHRLVLKAELYPSLEKGDGVAAFAACTSAAIDAYFPVGESGAGSAGPVDVLPTLRRVLMHSAISHLVGPTVLEAAPTFIEE